MPPGDNSNVHTLNNQQEKIVRERIAYLQDIVDNVKIIKSSSKGVQNAQEALDLATQHLNEKAFKQSDLNNIRFNGTAESNLSLTLINKMPESEENIQLKTQRAEIQQSNWNRKDLRTFNFSRLQVDTQQSILDQTCDLYVKYIGGENPTLLAIIRQEVQRKLDESKAKIEQAGNESLQEELLTATPRNDYGFEGFNVLQEECKNQKSSNGLNRLLTRIKGFVNDYLDPKLEKLAQSKKLSPTPLPKPPRRDSPTPLPKPPRRSSPTPPPTPPKKPPLTPPLKPKRTPESPQATEDAGNVYATVKPRSPKSRSPSPAKKKEPIHESAPAVPRRRSPTPLPKPPRRSSPTPPPTPPKKPPLTPPLKPKRTPESPQATEDAGNVYATVKPRSPTSRPPSPTEEQKLQEPIYGSAPAIPRRKSDNELDAGQMKKDLQSLKQRLSSDKTLKRQIDDSAEILDDVLQTYNVILDKNKELTQEESGVLSTVKPIAEKLSKLDAAVQSKKSLEKKLKSISNPKELESFAAPIPELNKKISSLQKKIKEEYEKMETGPSTDVPSNMKTVVGGFLEKQGDITYSSLDEMRTQAAMKTAPKSPTLPSTSPPGFNPTYAEFDFQREKPSLQQNSGYGPEEPTYVNFKKLEREPPSQVESQSREKYSMQYDSGYGDEEPTHVSPNQLENDGPYSVVDLKTFKKPEDSPKLNKSGLLNKALGKLGIGNSDKSPSPPSGSNSVQKTGPGV